MYELFRIQQWLTGGLIVLAAGILVSCSDTDDPLVYHYGYPQSVTLYEAADVGELSVSLAWTMSTDDDFLAYTVYYDTTSAVDTSDIYAGTSAKDYDTALTIASLERGRKYWFRVFVRNRLNLSVGSNIVSAQTSSGLPDSVTLYRVESVSDTTARLVWSPSRVDDFKAYRIRYSTSTTVSQSDSLVDSVSLVNDTTARVYGLPRGTRLTVSVFVVDTSNLERGSNARSFTTLSQPPQKVYLNNPPATTDSSVYLSWVPLGEEIFNYFSVYYDTASAVDRSDSLLADSLHRDSSSFTISGLKPATAYWFVVYGIDSLGNAYRSNETYTLTDDGTPAQVSFLKPDSVTDTSFYVRWHSSSEPDFNRYLLRWDTASTVDTSSPVLATFTNRSDTVYQVGGLSLSTQYRFKIYVENLDGLRSGSAVQVVTTTGIPVPVKGLQYYVQTLTDSSVRISWNSSTELDFRRYLVYTDTLPTVDTSDVLRDSIAQQDSVITTISGLRPGTRYYIRVYVEDEHNLRGGSDVISCLTYGATTCPAFVKKETSSVGNLSALPVGWYIYALENARGIYRSPLNLYQPYVIPNTSRDEATHLSILPDGKWILYLDNNSHTLYMIKPDGSHKTEVPLTGQLESGFPRACGVVYDSPLGTEIFYAAGYQVLRAVKIEFVNGMPDFSQTRTLADFSASALNPRFNTGGGIERINVNKNHLFSQIVMNRGTAGDHRSMGFITIPDNGRGTATGDDIYQFSDMPDTSIYGCGPAMSPDGNYVAHTPGSQGNPKCVPNRENAWDHKGFVMVPFQESGDPPIGRHEIVDVHARSINWCPPQYRYGNYKGLDFTSYQFGNHDDYLICKLSGTMVSDKGVWLVNWKTNVWTELTTLSVDAETPAVFFGDTLDPNDPQYRVVRPNGGEVCYVGEQCTVTVASAIDGNAAVNIWIGDNAFGVPGIAQSINPRRDSSFVFTVPEYFYKPGAWNPVTQQYETVAVSAVSDSCVIEIIDYSISKYVDYSDDYFSIQKR
ncbi:MAG: hypothetical protein GF398_13710 [Chitinivibrionales bacterium]|nr:hypothetical protein [Chitinivibrionales bacterium]